VSDVSGRPSNLMRAAAATGASEKDFFEHVCEAVLSFKRMVGVDGPLTLADVEGVADAVYERRAERGWYCPVRATLTFVIEDGRLVALRHRVGSA
jgi:hypothetical protein